MFNSDSPEGMVVSIPLQNALLVTDDPVESQSIVGSFLYVLFCGPAYLYVQVLTRDTMHAQGSDI